MIPRDGIDLRKSAYGVCVLAALVVVLAASAVVDTGAVGCASLHPSGMEEPHSMQTA